MAIYFFSFYKIRFCESIGRQTGKLSKTIVCQHTMCTTVVICRQTNRSNSDYVLLKSMSYINNGTLINVLRVTPSNLTVLLLNGNDWGKHQRGCSATSGQDAWGFRDISKNINNAPDQFG